MQISYLLFKKAIEDLVEHTDGDLTEESSIEELLDYLSENLNTTMRI